MTLLVKLVEWTAIVGLIGFALFFESWREGGRARAAESEEQPQAAVTPQQVKQPQTTLDAAFHQATEQYYAGLETGQGGRMPTRAQVAADLASITGEHDEVPITTAELLSFAALAAGFERAFRPPIAADTDPDGTTAW